MDNRLDLMLDIAIPKDVKNEPEIGRAFIIRLW